MATIDQKKMTTIDIKRDHKIQLEAVKQYAQSIAEEYHRKLQIKWRWEKGDLDFCADKGLAKGTYGTLIITALYVRVLIKLPTKFKPFKNSIVNTVESRLDKLSSVVSHSNDSLLVEGDSSMKPSSDNNDKAKSRGITNANNKIGNRDTSIETLTSSEKKMSQKTGDTISKTVSHLVDKGSDIVSEVIEESNDKISVGAKIEKELKHAEKAADSSINTLQSLLKFLAIAGMEDSEILSSPFWRWLLILLCLLGCGVNMILTIHGTTNLLVIVEKPVPTAGLILLACFPIFILFLSKQILMDKMGGGTLLFIFFVFFWCVCLVFNVSTTYWVYKVSYRLSIPENVRSDVATLMREILPLGAAVVTTIPPILLGVLFFPEIKRKKSVR